VDAKPVPVIDEGTELTLGDDKSEATTELPAGSIPGTFVFVAIVAPVSVAVARGSRSGLLGSRISCQQY
jgi:hypothetical protein